MSLQKRKRCPAGGRDYTTFSSRWRWQPDDHHMMNCPMCNKRVTLRIKPGSGTFVIIPQHNELVVGA